MHGWVHAGNERLLRRLLRDRAPRVAVELGSWLGLCSSLLLEADPELTLFCVDTWDEALLLGPQHVQYAADAGALDILRSGVSLHDTFLRNMWRFRRRCFPLRMRSLDGLAAIHALGVQVDLVYVDADHAEASVLAELRALRRLFPTATVCGDDWQWLGVRRAVVAFAAEAGVEVASHPKENWWLLQPLRLLEPRARAAASGVAADSHVVPFDGPDPKRARVVEFTSGGRA